MSFLSKNDEILKLCSQKDTFSNIAIGEKNVIHFMDFYFSL